MLTRITHAGLDIEYPDGSIFLNYIHGNESDMLIHGIKLSLHCFNNSGCSVGSITIRLTFDQAVDLAHRLLRSAGASVPTPNEE